MPEAVNAVEGINPAFTQAVKFHNPNLWPIAPTSNMPSQWSGSSKSEFDQKPLTEEDQHTNKEKDILIG